MAGAGRTPAPARPPPGGGTPGRLQVVERVLGGLTPASRSVWPRLIAFVTGTLDRDRLEARYQAYRQALAEGPQQQRSALRALRAGFERYQDACSADDYQRVQQAYPEIDATLARLTDEAA